MSSRSERLTALEAGPLGEGDPLLLAQRFLIWKRWIARILIAIAVLILSFASLLIGSQLGALLFSMSR